MVSKRLYCGSNGFNGSYVPKAPRSCRKRSLPNRTEDIQMCAIDLLATLAGKLLQESESSSASTNAFEDNKQFDVDKEGKQEQEAECKKLKAESTDTGISDSKSSTENKLEKGLLNEYPSDEKVVDGTSMSGSGYLPKLKGAFTGESCDVSVNNVTKHLQEETKGMGTGDLSPGNTCNSKDTMESFTRVRNQTKLGGRDVENIFRCGNFSNKFKSHKLSTYMGDRRLRKLLSSKHWKTVPKLKDVEHVRADGAPKPQYPKRKMCYGQKSYQLDSVYKKRKLSDRSSVLLTSDGGFSGRSVSNSAEKSNAENEEISHHLNDSYVRLNIKSFKIPELCVEVPESTTVGSLKSAVLEAVTALLGDGIRVGVLIQGKKVRDDKKTLSQKGISCGENLDLGFTLEPDSNPTICSEDPPSLLPDASSLLKRPASSPTMDSGISSSCPDSDSLTVSDNHIGNNLELAPFQLKTTEEPISDSRALVPVPAMNVDSLAIVPVNQRPKRSELAQRRTRRPFSVPEVEALVQAVEEIGTGRWRDVKLRAFQNADHRTYVDLKDKWKTLVHTASIAPQQRRGQPVPQELLDRVLAAHGHWSQHQTKQQHCIDTVNRAPKVTDADGTQQVGILQAV